MGGRLQGCGILIVRPAGLGEALAERVQAEGGEPILLPAIDILSAPRPARLAMVIARLHTFDWAIFISPTAAREGMRSVRERRFWPEGVRVAAVGRGSAEVLAELGIKGVLAPQAPGDSDALAALPELQEITGQNIVIFRGDGGREHLARVFAERGARVEYAECYRRVRPDVDMSDLLARWRSGGVQAICGASSEALANLRDMAGTADSPVVFGTPVFVPHPRVAEAARAMGFLHAIVATGGDAAIAEALAAFFATV